MKYARKCDITGKGMNEGYCFGDGIAYASDEKSATKIAKDMGYSSLQESYEDENHYFTTWEEIDEDYYYTEDGEYVEV